MIVLLMAAFEFASIVSSCGRANDNFEFAILRLCARGIRLSKKMRFRTIRWNS